MHEDLDVSYKYSTIGCVGQNDQNTVGGVAVTLGGVLVVGLLGNNLDVIVH